MSDLVKRYTSSVFFDKRLWQADIAGSLAHADMLAAQNIIGAADHESIKKGMAQITAEIESGAFEWKLDLEDVHLNIEARLTQIVGDAGKRLHTGRSRNDQVATDVRVWLRGEIDLIADLLTDLQKALVDIADKNVEVILPGFTHLQVAQPVSFGHHMLAYVEMFSRDAERMLETIKLVKDAGGEIETATCDVTQSASIASVVEACINRFGSVDILINNVGGSAAGGPVEMTEEVWDAQIDHNLKSVFLTCKYVLPLMEKQGSGAIVNISSTSGLRWTGSAQVAYASTKAGVIQFSRVTAVQYAKKGIRVNTVVPGQLYTPMVDVRLAKQRSGGDVTALLQQRQSL